MLMHGHTLTMFSFHANVVYLHDIGMHECVIGNYLQEEQYQPNACDAYDSMVITS